MSCVNKLYALIWGQCTDGLQSVLEFDLLNKGNNTKLINIPSVNETEKTIC